MFGNKSSSKGPVAVEMDLCLLFLAFSLLLSTGSSLSNVSNGLCSSKLMEGHHHLNSSGGLHLTLHHPQGPCSSPPPSPLPSPPSSSTTPPAPAPSSARAAPPPPPRRPRSPGRLLGVGNYVARIGLGSPATSYSMVVDTGSSLTWLQCSPCVVSCHPQLGPVFDPAASATYRRVPCSASQCSALRSATLNPAACSPSGHCIYQATYGDSSFSLGLLSADTLSLARRTFPGFVYGCGQDNEGLFGRSAGLIGLARNNLSMLYQVAPKLGSLSFSYCLPTPKSTGFLSLGPYADVAASRVSYTPMAPSDLDPTLYFVRLARVAVAGTPLDLAPEEYAALPTILDTGTGAGGGAGVPEVELAFEGGATMRLPAENVMVDVDSRTTCLAFAPASRVAIIGNRLQQTFRLVFDVARSRIGFAAAGCG
uniref:Peptidase A1 domain-containing protein n=1 Tax=Ananas comosus var. bracteatus TaxID=296719 RepID=A0A6V7QVY9_ANACO